MLFGHRGKCGRRALCQALPGVEYAVSGWDVPGIPQAHTRHGDHLPDARLHARLQSTSAGLPSVLFLRRYRAFDRADSAERLFVSSSRRIVAAWRRRKLRWLPPGTMRHWTELCELCRRTHSLVLPTLLRHQHSIELSRASSLRPARMVSSHASERGRVWRRFDDLSRDYVLDRKPVDRASREG